MAMGVRSASGFESEVQHLYGGKTETVTCDDDGKPIAGNGAHAVTAQQKCAAEREDQRGKAPWWVAAGLGVTIYGITQFKKARSG